MILFRVLSYNIWFDEEDREVRLVALFHEILKQKMVSESPLLAVAFQEVTRDTFPMIYDNMTSMGYVMCNKIYNKPYFDLIFILNCVPIKEYDSIIFENSKQGRVFNWVTIEYATEEITLSTSHLESLPSSQMKRIEQINHIQKSTKQFSKSSSCIFLGDTNLRDEYDILIASPWKDAWVEKGTKDNKYTYDAINNKYVSCRGKRTKSARFDRIFYHGNINIENYDLVGKVLVDEQTTEHIEISDHYGVTAEFSIADDSKDEYDDSKNES